jgi:LysM repeat protein
MDNNDNHLKSPQTGGLKLMTVFIVVLALHVVVIGGFTVYHLMSGGGTDADFAGDKAHKGVKIATDADAPLPDGSTAPAPATASNPSTAATTPTTDASAPADMNPESAEPPPATAAATASTTPAPAPDASTPSTPATPDASMTAAATAPAATTTTTSTPSDPLASGPVISPSPASAPTGMQNDETAEQEAVAPTVLDGDVAPAKPYTVKLHDSLAKIAHRNHISVAQLRTTNNLKTDMLRIGQKLMIPATATEVAATDSKKAQDAAPDSHGPNRTLLGDDVPDSAVPSKKTVASTAHDEAMVMPASSSRHTYTVVKGDTLSKIAHRFHLTTSTLMAANDSVDARKLRIGQKLHIPSQGSRSANIATPAPATQPEVPKAQPEPAEIQPMATPSAQLANFMP